MLGVRGSRAAVRFSKLSFMAHFDFEKGSQNQLFQSTLFVGREMVTKRSNLCTLLITLTILDDHEHLKTLKVLIEFTVGKIKSLKAIYSVTESLKM